MLGHHYQKSQYQSAENFHAYADNAKINFITHFFLKILQRNSKLVLLGNLGMPGHTHLKLYNPFEETSVYLQAKTQFHPSHFPWDIGKNYNLVISGTFDMPGYTHSKVILSTCRKLSGLSAGPKSINVSLGMLQRYANFLFWLLWTCLTTHTYNVCLIKTLMFICMPKINFLHFFLEISHFKESYNLIGQQHFGL